MKDIFKGLAITLAIFLLGAVFIALALKIGFLFMLGCVLFVVIWVFIVQIILGNIK